MLDGFGTELGILNLFLFAVGVASMTILVRRVRLLLTTDWEKNLRRHKIMWAHYVRQRLEKGDSGDIKDLMD